MASEVFFVLLDCWIINPFKQLTGRFEAGEFMERMFKASHEFRSKQRLLVNDRGQGYRGLALEALCSCSH